jgi:hypothetical protein
LTNTNESATVAEAKKFREHLQEFAKSTWHPSNFGKRKNYAPTV